MFSSTRRSVRVDPRPGRSWGVVAIGFSFAMVLCGCNGTSDAPRSPAERKGAAEPPAASETIVGRVGKREITSKQLDVPLQLALHDLDMQKYRLRRKALEVEVLRELERASTTVHSAELLLEPPAPPRVPVEADASRVRPAGAAPVTVLAFCNFESPHCARLQVTLAQVLPLFPGVVRYAERALPLEYHRHAAEAAAAAHCALDQGNYWRFHDVLYAGGSALDRSVLERAARTSDLEPAAFANCVDEGRHANDVTVDSALAQSLGVAAVPAVFVNGLYASPDVSGPDLVWLIERELAALDTPSPRLVAAADTGAVPFQLRQVLVSATPGQGLALLAPSVASDRVAAFREGDLVATGIVVRRIDKDGIDVLLQDGKTERLGFGPATKKGDTSSARENAVDPAIAQPHHAVPVTLDRNRVLALMSDRIALAGALQPVPMTAGGHRLLKIKEVAPGSLYDLLGLQAGDVIVGVNEQPVTEAFNPLWDALEQNDEVRLRVMRRGGLAQHYAYRFSK